MSKAKYEEAMDVAKTEYLESFDMIEKKYKKTLQRIKKEYAQSKKAIKVGDFVWAHFAGCGQRLAKVLPTSAAVIMEEVPAWEVPPGQFYIEFMGVFDTVGTFTPGHNLVKAYDENGPITKFPESEDCND